MTGVFEEVTVGKLSRNFLWAPQGVSTCSSYLTALEIATSASICKSKHPPLTSI